MISFWVCTVTYGLDIDGEHIFAALLFLLICTQDVSVLEYLRTWFYGINISKTRSSRLDGR